MFNKGIGLSVLVLIILIGIQATRVSSWEIDQTDKVISVIDGDTFRISNNSVRLADINAPENGTESGFSIAKYALANMVEGKIVSLDIDQKSGRDPYGRLVAVVYVKYNSTQYLNVNEALLIQGVAVENDYTNNEFNPSNWTLYVRYADTLVNPSDVLALISNAQTSVLTWLAVGLGILIGVKSTTEPSERITQIGIGVSVFSLGMIIFHMGDIYNWRAQLPKDYLPSSINNPILKLMDSGLDYIYNHPYLILIICIFTGIILEIILDTKLWKKINPIKNKGSSTLVANDIDNKVEQLHEEIEIINMKIDQIIQKLSKT